MVEKHFKSAPVKLPGDSLMIDDLTITFKNDNMYSTWKFIYEWILDNFYTSDFVVTSPSLYILNRKDIPLFSISLNNIFPFSISEIENTRTNNMPEIQTFTASFKVNQISINDSF